MCSARWKWLAKDITGKALEQPIYNLLGSLVNPRLRSYTYLYPDENEDESFCDRPFGDYCVTSNRAGRKFGPIGDYDVDPRQPTMSVWTCRSAFATGARSDERQGRHLFGTWPVHGIGAKRLAPLEKYDPLWFEEPTPRTPDLMAEVARCTCIPIATGERLYQVRICASDRNRCGNRSGRSGTCRWHSGSQKIAGKNVMHSAPHLYCGQTAAANIQLAACIQIFVQGIQQMGSFLLAKTRSEWADGYVIPSRHRAWVWAERRVALAHPYIGKGLHLGMAQQPLGYY